MDMGNTFLSDFRVAEETTGESLLTSGASLIECAPLKLESEMPS
jgi:hypothetical protein